MARKGDEIDKMISDLYLARKLIYQHCKVATSLNDLENILMELERDIPELGLIFDAVEFGKAWKMTISELKTKFEISDSINH